MYLTSDRKPNFFYGYVVVGAIFCAMMIIWGTYYTFGTFFKPLLTEFGWTRAITSGAFSLCTILTGFFMVGVGRLTDKFGPRVAVTGCGLFLGLGYLLMSQISAIWQLYLFYGVIVAIGMGGSFIPAVSTAARWFVKRRGLMTGIVLSGIGAGTILVPPIATRLIAAYGWSTSYIIVGIIALVFITLAAQFLKRDPSQIGLLPYGADEVENESLALQIQGFSFREAVRTRQFWILWLLEGCFGFCLFTVMVHIVPHAIEVGISAITAANILAIIGGVGIAGRLMIGGASDRIGNKKAIIVGLTLMSVALLWLLIAKEIWMLYLFGAIFGFGYGGFSAAESPLAAELFGLSSHGVILGAAALGFTIFGAIGPVLAGHIFDITGSYQRGFAVCAALSITGSILALLLRPPSKKDSRSGE